MGRIQLVCLLDSRTHKVDRPLKHPHSKMKLSRRFGCILPTGDHIQSRSSFRVISKYDLFACYGLKPEKNQDMLAAHGNRTSQGWNSNLGLHMVCRHCVVVETVLATPFEGCFEPFDCLLLIPFGCA